MNSLFKKFLLYNIIGVGLIAGIVTFTLQVSQKNLIDEKVQQVSSHSSSVDKYLNQYSYNKNIIELLQDFRITKEINSILENKNISIIILDDFKNILFDSKGYDLNKDAFSNKNLVIIGDEDENLSIIDNQNEILGRAFINKDIFNSKFKEITTNNNQNFIIKSNSNFEKNKSNLFQLNELRIMIKISILLLMKIIEIFKK